MKQVEGSKSEACLAKGNLSSALEKKGEQMSAGLPSSTPMAKSSQKPLSTASNTYVWRQKHGSACKS